MINLEKKLFDTDPYSFFKKENSPMCFNLDFRMIKNYTTTINFKKFTF